MQKILLLVFIAVLVSVVVNSSSKSVKVINSTDIGHIKLTAAPEKKSVYYVYPERERKEEHHNTSQFVKNITVLTHERDEQHSSTLLSQKGDKKPEQHSSTLLSQKGDKKPEQHSSTLTSQKVDKNPEQHSSTLSAQKIDKNPVNHNSTSSKHKDEKCYVRVLENNEYVIYNNTREEVENSGKVIHDILCVDDDDRVLGAGTIASIGG